MKSKMIELLHKMEVNTTETDCLLPLRINQIDGKSAEEIEKCPGFFDDFNL